MWILLPGIFLILAESGFFCLEGLIFEWLSVLCWLLTPASVSHSLGAQVFFWKSGIWTLFGISVRDTLLRLLHFMQQ